MAFPAWSSQCSDITMVCCSHKRRSACLEWRHNFSGDIFGWEFCSQKQMQNIFHIMTWQVYHGMSTINPSVQTSCRGCEICGTRLVASSIDQLWIVHLQLLPPQHPLQQSSPRILCYNIYIQPETKWNWIVLVAQTWSLKMLKELRWQIYLTSPQRNTYRTSC